MCSLRASSRARGLSFTDTNYNFLHSWAMLINKLEKKLGNDRKAVEASLLFKNFTVTGFCEKSQATICVAKFCTPL